MEPPFPCPVSTWHNNTYPAIAPQRDELSSAGKTVIITGAVSFVPNNKYPNAHLTGASIKGSGIGRETAIAFAAAGAEHIVLVGRKESTLSKTRAAVLSGTRQLRCTAFPADVNDEKAMNQIATDIGTWDVFILNAAYIAEPTTIASANISQYWASYETNVKSVVVAAIAFLPTANKTHATILGVTAGALHFPPSVTPGLSSYLTSKLAMTKILEFLAVENPSVFVASVHPGMIDTEIFRRSGATPDMLPMDSSKLFHDTLLDAC
ncbi:hypothetical protein ACLMJK_002765 [Lecanora helva]